MGSKAEIGSENSTSPEPLVTLTKSRPKMRTGRKPPSRAGRKLAIEASNAMSFDVTDAPTEKIDSNDQNISIADQTQSKPPLGGISILGGLSDALKKRKTDKTESENILNSSNEIRENVDDDIENGDEIKTTANIEDSVDLNENKTPDLNEKLDKKKNLFGFDDSDSDDDMFSSLPTPKKNTTNTDPIADIFESDSDDDLFSSLSKK